MKRGRRSVVAVLRCALALSAAVIIFAPAFAQRGATKTDTKTTSGRPLPENAPKVEATFDRDSIGIGDHFMLTVGIEKDIVQQVDFPHFQNGRINDHIEVLADLPPDTSDMEGRRITLSKQYLLTTFEEGIHVLGHFPVLYVDKNIMDTVWSALPLQLQVGTFEIDTLTQTIYDIKLPVAAPFRIGEIAGWALLSLLILMLIAGGIYLLIRYREKIPFLAPKPVLPPHVVAIQALEALHHQKMWQNSKHKQYYTVLTEILREYLFGRYGIRALEMTSEEITGAVRLLDLTPKLFNDLSSLLFLSDLVKFAKFIPEADDNETAYFNAYYFVEETKEVVEAVSEESGEPNPVQGGTGDGRKEVAP